MGNQSCKIDNGEGEKSWWPWSECKLKTCNSGYENTSGKCTASLPTGSCTLNPSYPGEKSYSYDETGTCVVDSCDTGYVLKNGECVKDSKVEESPKPISVPGWNADVATKFKIFDTHEETPKPSVPTIQACSDLTKKRAGNAFTYRDSTEKEAGYASTCAGYGNIPQGYTLVGDMIPAPAQISACVDPTKTFPNCGGGQPSTGSGGGQPSTGSGTAPLLHKYDPDMAKDYRKFTQTYDDLDSCQAFARSPVYPTRSNPPSRRAYTYNSKTNECVIYDRMPTGYTLPNNPDDDLDITSGCVDTTNTFPDCSF